MSPITLDRIDLKILDELQRDASLTNVELATRVALSPSPCLARVKALEKAGVIDRRVALLNPNAIGLGLSVFINVKLERQVSAALDTFHEAIERLDEVMECYLLAGDADYLIRVVVRDVQGLEELIINKLAKIPGVSNIRASCAIKQIRHKTALPLGPEWMLRGAAHRTRESHGGRLGAFAREAINR